MRHRAFFYTKDCKLCRSAEVGIFESTSPPPTQKRSGAEQKGATLEVQSQSDCMQVQNGGRISPLNSTTWVFCVVFDVLKPYISDRKYRKKSGNVFRKKHDYSRWDIRGIL